MYSYCKHRSKNTVWGIKIVWSQFEQMEFCYFRDVSLSLSSRTHANHTGAMTLSIMTFSIQTLSIMGLIAGLHKWQLE
jgi:hypothetical protein